jgi:hypothetical protein
MENLVALSLALLSLVNPVTGPRAEAISAALATAGAPSTETSDGAVVEISGLTCVRMTSSGGPTAPVPLRCAFKAIPSDAILQVDGAKANRLVWALEDVGILPREQAGVETWSLPSIRCVTADAATECWIDAAP